MRSSDRGGGTLETVIVFPAVLLAVLLAVQAALWFHARAIALSSAQEGVRTSRAYDARISDGQKAALDFAHDTGDGLLLEPEVDTSGSDASTVEFRVSGKSVSLIPGFRAHVSQVARGPRERWTTPSGGAG